MLKPATRFILSAVIGVSASMPLAASATPVGMDIGAIPMIAGGVAPDSPASHVDSNSSLSQLSGVVSIAVERLGRTSICTGALIGKRSVMSAAHCFDSNGKGSMVKLSDPQVKVSVIFNSNGSGNAVIRAASLSAHTNYDGFGVCPSGSGFCLNDDIAVLNLVQDAPASARTYKIASNTFTDPMMIMLAGYGASGNGVQGFTVNPSFLVKRFGFNFADYYAPDDEGGGHKELWVADYDGLGRDSSCTLLGVCSPVFVNAFESATGPGDSGGAMFVRQYGEWMIAGNSTFSSDPLRYGEGRYGTLFGGSLISAYTGFLAGASTSRLTMVPEPDVLLVFGIGLAALCTARRRGTPAAV